MKNSGLGNLCMQLKQIFSLCSNLIGSILYVVLGLGILVSIITGNIFMVFCLTIGWILAKAVGLKIRFCSYRKPDGTFGTTRRNGTISLSQINRVKLA